MKKTSKKFLSVALSFFMTLTLSATAVTASPAEDDTSYALSDANVNSADDYFANYDTSMTIYPATRYSTNSQVIEKELNGEKSCISTVQGSSCWTTFNNTLGNFCVDFRAFLTPIDGAAARDSESLRIKDDTGNSWHNLITIKSDGTIGSTSYTIPNETWFNLRIVVNTEEQLMDVYYGENEDSLELIAEGLTSSIPQTANVGIFEVTKGGNGAHIFNFSSLKVSYIQHMYKAAANCADKTEFNNLVEKNNRLGFFEIPSDFDNVDDEDFVMEKLFGKKDEYTSTSQIYNFLSNLASKHNVGIKILSSKLINSAGDDVSSETLKGITSVKSVTNLVSTSGSEENFNVVTALYEKSAYGNKTFCSYSVKNAAISPEGIEVQSDEFELDADKEYCVRVFFWDSTESPLKMAAYKKFNDFADIDDINSNPSSESIDTDVSVIPESGNIKITGNAAGGDGSYLFASVKSPSGKLVYTDQVYTYGDNGSFTVTFTLSSPSEPGTYSVTLCTNSGVSKADTFDLESDTVKPSVNSVKINGETYYGATVSVDYNYFQIGGVEEGSSKYEWLISDKEDGDYTAIDGASAKTLLLDRSYSGKYIKATVTPVTNLNTEGDTEYTENIIRVVMLPEVSDVKIEGNAESGNTISVVYKFVEPLFGYAEKGTEYAWYKGSQLVGTEQSYKISDRDVGSYIYCVVTPKIEQYPYVGKSVETSTVRVTSSDTKKGSSGGGGGGGGSFTTKPPVSSGNEKVDDNTSSTTPDTDTVAKIFADTKDHWAKNSISNLCAKGIVKGIDDTHFNPDGYITRAEFAALICRILNTDSDISVMPFDDVENTAWYHDDISKIYSLGIMKGDGGKFRPNDKITRQEMALTLFGVYVYKYGTAPKSAENTGFADYKDIASWAYDAVMYCTNAGLIKGDANGAFNPTSDTTRAEAVTVIERVINLR